MTWGRRLAAGLLAALASYAVVPVAAAETEVRRDPVGDVRVDDGDAPTTPVGDITRLVTRHADRVLEVVVHLRAYPTAGPRMTTIGIQTSSGGRLTAYRYRRYESLVHQDNTPIACPGLRERGSARTRTITWVIPRSCLGEPTWVRVNVLLQGHVAGQGYAEDSMKHGSELSAGHGPGSRPAS